MPCDELRELELQQERERRNKEQRDRKKKEQREKSLKTIKDQAIRLGWTLKGNDKWKFDAVKPNGDTVHFEILEDGIIKTKTDKISMVNHQNAEQFLLDIARSLGGKWRITHKHGGHTHSHALEVSS